LVAGFSSRKPTFVLRAVQWDLQWTKWYWDRFFSESFGLRLPISLHRCSTSIHILQTKLYIYTRIYYNFRDGLITRPRSPTICLNSSRNLLYVRRPRSFKDCRATWGKKILQLDKNTEAMERFKCKLSSYYHQV
jgi:hypothetical protein